MVLAGLGAAAKSGNVYAQENVVEKKLLIAKGNIVGIIGKGPAVPTMITTTTTKTSASNRINPEPTETPETEASAKSIIKTLQKQLGNCQTLIDCQKDIINNKKNEINKLNKANEVEIIDVDNNNNITCIIPQRGTKSKKRKRSTMMVELDKNRKRYKEVKTEKIATQNQLEKINNEVDDKYKCSICYEHDRTVVFLPCKHLCCCANCGKVDVTLNCPICREDINSRINIFL